MRCSNIVRILDDSLDWFVIQSFNARWDELLTILAKVKLSCKCSQFGQSQNLVALQQCIYQIYFFIRTNIGMIVFSSIVLAQNMWQSSRQNRFRTKCTFCAVWSWSTQSMKNYFRWFQQINPLPDDQILDWSKINVCQKLKFLLGSKENTEIVCKCTVLTGPKSCLAAVNWSNVPFYQYKYQNDCIFKYCFGPEYVTKQ